MSVHALRRSSPDVALPRLVSPRNAEIEAAIDAAGCAIVENALPAEVILEVSDALAPWFDRARCGEGLFFGRHTKRFSGLFAKAPQTAVLALHSQMLELAEKLLLGPAEAPHGECVQLNLTQAIEIGPGEPAQLPHRDDSLFPFAKAFEVMVNVMWPLDAFTSQNGATCLAPGSHRWTRDEAEVFGDGFVDAVAPVGSAIIWVGSLAHGGGANKSKTPRRGVVMSYSLAWLAPAEKLLLSTPPDVARALPERLQRLIGYQVHRPNLGWVEGCDPIEWLRGEIGPIASARDNLTPLQDEMMHAHFAAVDRQ